MWKKNKHQGLYGDFSELDKNTPVNNKKLNQNDLLNDRFGFYNRDIIKNNNDKNLNNISSNFQDSEKKINNIKLNNNNNLSSINSIQLINERLNNLDKKIQLLNKNIIILNNNLNIAKNKINQNLILETEDLLNISHFANKKMKEQYEEDKQSLLNSNKITENNIYDVITNAKNKNDFIKNNNINDDKNLEKNIQNKARTRDNIDNKYSKMYSNFDFSENQLEDHFKEITKNRNE